MAESLVHLHVERLAEGGYLATCNSIPGLIAQGRTVTETLDIARDVAKKLVEARAERGEKQRLIAMEESFELPLVVNAC
jgi:predicted RNase H-like HicB family nuclease